jgi:predicted metal-binding protein
MPDLSAFLPNARTNAKGAGLLLAGHQSLEREMFLDGCYKAFAMSCGPCNLCRSCDVTGPCKFEEIARPSMEACGIDVFATLANVSYKLKVVRSADETCHFCGMILVD